MTMSADHGTLATRLDAAERNSRPIAPFAADHRLTLADAYDLQRHWVARKLGDGRRRIGHKVGFTSCGIQRMLGVAPPCFGTLLDDMLLPDGRDIALSRFIAPRIEVELAFIMRDGLPSGERSIFDILNAVDYVVPALEIIDGRVGPNPTATDIVADNAGNAGIILGGNPVRPGRIDLQRVAALLHRNGTIEDSGVSATVLGHPANSIVALLGAAQTGEVLAGDIILTGAFTTPLPLSAGDTIHADYGPLGSISVRFT